MYEVLSNNRVRKMPEMKEPTSNENEFPVYGQMYNYIVNEKRKWKEELAKQPIYNISGPHLWKEGQLIEEGKDFMFTWPRDLSKPTFETAAGPQHPFMCVVMATDVWLARSAPSTDQKEIGITVHPQEGYVIAGGHFVTAGPHPFNQ